MYTGVIVVAAVVLGQLSQDHNLNIFLNKMIFLLHWLDLLFFIFHVKIFILNQNYLIINLKWSNLDLYS